MTVHAPLDLHPDDVAPPIGPSARAHADPEPTNQVIRAANRLFFGRGVVAVVLSAFFGFLWLQLFTDPTSLGLDLPAVLCTVAAQMTEGGVDPAGALGAFGTIAIAAAVAMLESSRRLEALDSQRSSPAPGTSVPQLRRNIHSSQLVSFVEFFLLALAAGFAALLAGALGAVGNTVLSVIAWLLCAFLVVCAWRFLLAFDFLVRLQFRPPEEALVARFALLRGRTRQRAVATVSWWTILAALLALLVVNTLGTPLHGGNAGIMAALLCILPLTAVGLCRMYGRAALHEVGVSRFATITLTTAMSTVWGGILPVIVFSSAIDTDALRSDAAGQRSAVTALVAMIALGIMLGYRAFDQAGVPASLSSVGFEVAALDGARPIPAASRAAAWASGAWHIGGALAAGVLIGIVLELDPTRPVGNASAVVFTAFVYTALGASALTLAVAARWSPTAQRRSLLAIVSLHALGVAVFTAFWWPAPVDGRGTATLVWCAAMLLTALPTALAFRDETTWRTAVADYWQAQRIENHRARNPPPPTG